MAWPPLHRVLLVDIQTVPQHPDATALPPEVEQLAQLRAAASSSGLAMPQYYTQRAALHAELGRVAGIGLAYFSEDEGEEGPLLRCNGLVHASEAEMLGQLGRVLGSSRWGKGGPSLVAHHGTAFDFPFLGRRYLLLGLPLPTPLNVQLIKSWERPWLDTMELWQFGDRKATISMPALALALGLQVQQLPHPSSTLHSWYQQGQWERIQQHCSQQVLLLAQIYLRLSGRPALPPQRVLLAPA